MAFAATDLDRILLALVAHGGVAIDATDAEGIAPHPRPAAGGGFAPMVQQRMNLLLDIGLVGAGPAGRAHLTLYGLEVLRGGRAP
jgi:hypothetical protein